MAKQVTRTVTTWNATAYKVELHDGNPTIKTIGAVTYDSQSTTQTEARAALKAAGYEVPRGVTVDVQKVCERKFALEMETFMRYAHEVTDDEEVEE